MSFANANISDIIATTIQSRSRKIADNVTKNNGLLTWLNKRGNMRTFSGGSSILEELSFQENTNAGYYSGYDLLPVQAQDVITAAEYGIKQAAVAVVISGLEQLQNSGKEQMIDLMEARVNVAESSMQNLLAAGVYSDGTAFSGKQVSGLNSAVPTTPTSGVYGGIDRASWTFWRNKATSQAGVTAANIQGYMNTMWASLIRGADRPDLIVVDNVFWGLYMASLQVNQRFTDPSTASLGFPTVKYMQCDMLLDGAIGGFASAGTAYFLNTKYIFWRPHKDRNMVPLSPNKRYALNQDAEATILAWAGNMTMSGAQFQGRLTLI